MITRWKGRALNRKTLASTRQSFEVPMNSACRHLGPISVGLSAWINHHAGSGEVGRSM
jgi:hypothetical protein